MIDTRRHDDHCEVLVPVDRCEDEVVEVLTSTNPFQSYLFVGRDLVDLTIPAVPVDV